MVVFPTVKTSALSHGRRLRLETHNTTILSSQYTPCYLEAPVYFQTPPHILQHSSTSFNILQLTLKSPAALEGNPISQEARIYYFDNCPSAECHLAEVMQAVAWEPTEVRTCARAGKFLMNGGLMGKFILRFNRLENRGLIGKWLVVMFFFMASQNT